MEEVLEVYFYSHIDEHANHNDKMLESGGREKTYESLQPLIGA